VIKVPVAVVWKHVTDEFNRNVLILYNHIIDNKCSRNAVSV